jgi:hypothetical protein
MGARNHFTFCNQHSTDRNLAIRESPASFLQGQFHEAFIS